MNKKNILQKIIGIFRRIFCKECTYEECIEKATKAAGITTEKIGGAISIPSID